MTEKKESHEIQSIKEKALKIVGTFQKNKNYGFVIPDDRKLSADIFIPGEKSGNAPDGQKVVAEITAPGNVDKQKSPEGKIIEVLGNIDTPGVDILSVIKGYDLPAEFSDKEFHQAQRVAKAVSTADCAGRMDMRNILMVTIDGEDAKDLDDAVSLTMENDVYRLGVHIADVSNYVQENSALDREALKRGTSVYLADRVIPMLPEALSNGICSLNEGEDRLALSCLMQIDNMGSVLDYQITESVIRVNRRMTYTAVQKILDKTDDIIRKEYEALVPMLEKMEELAMLLRKNREKRGSIDFDFPESKMILNQEGVPLEIKPYERNTATKLIEEFMLLANETVAQHFYWLDIPFLYRTHESPEQEKIRKLAVLMRNMGFGMKTGRAEIHPKEIQKLLWQAEGTASEALVGRLALRSMKQAKYTGNCSGHFGLACQYYCHFTSPIRRYPDLYIHRLIKQQLRGRLSEEKTEHYREISDAVASQCSTLERRAKEAERECEKIKKAEYMARHIGENFSGVVSGVSAWGLYVELENTVEGLVNVSDLPSDFYRYEESQYALIGERTGRIFSLGQRLVICVKRADKATKYIDFVLAGDEE